jgi:hypothetical protein
VTRGGDYQHTQIGWVVIASLGVALLLFLAVMVRVQLVAPFLIAAVVLLAALALFATLTVTVDAEALRWRFGIGLIRGRVPLHEIRYFSAVKNPWYYGWGIRFYPGGTLYNVSGLHAVELWRQGGKRFRIGTDDPRGLAAAIEARIGRPAPLSPEEERQSQRAAKVAVVIALGLFVAIVGGLAAIFYFEERPPEVTVTTEGIVIESLMYGERLRWSEVEDAALVDRLPRIGARTNGYALGGTLRGHFRLAEWGRGKLFIEYSTPPYIVLFSASSYVVVNCEDAEETEQLFARIGEYTETRRVPAL